MTGVDDMNDEPRGLEDELGAYLLGALDPDEERRVEELLETSESARETLRWMKPAVELLAEAVEHREPPPALRDRILSEVGAAAEPSGAPSPATKRRSWFSFGGFSMRPAMGLAALALIAVVAGIGIGGYEIGTGGGGQDQTIIGPTATVERHGDSGILQLTGLRQLPPSRNYQAWVQHGDRMLPSSPFAVRKNGTASAAIPHDLDGADAVVVTVEPRGGSRSPTTDPVASVALPN